VQPEQIGYAASSGPVERYFPIARRQRVSWLEFSCQNPVNFPQTFDRSRIRRVRSLIERSGIRCGLHSASFVNTAEIMPTVRKAALDHLREYVDLTAALGCEYLVVHCGFHFSAYLDTVHAALYETMARAVAYGERRRVPLVIENMNQLPGDSEFQYLGVRVDEFHRLFDRIPSPYLGLALGTPPRRHRAVRPRVPASDPLRPALGQPGSGRRAHDDRGGDDRLPPRARRAPSDALRRAADHRAVRCAEEAREPPSPARAPPGERRATPGADSEAAAIGPSAEARARL
jgi:hypothetical protein